MKMTLGTLSKHSAGALLVLVVALIAALACAGAQVTGGESVVRPLRAPESAHLSVGVQHQTPSYVAGSRSVCASSVSSPDPGAREQQATCACLLPEAPGSFLGTTAPLRI